MTHINAYIEDLNKAVALVKGAVSEMEQAKDALAAKVAGDDPQPANPPQDARPADAGAAEAKTGKAKYK